MKTNAIADLARFLVATKLLRRREPLLASVKLTYRCNLACQACPFHQRAHAENTHLTWDMARHSLDELHRMGCRIVIFEGGEPLLWKDGPHDFAQLAAYARERFLCVGATTNGTLPLIPATDVLWVSIDGGKDTHDRLRSDSYDRVLRNLHATVHPKVFIHYTLNRENWRDFPATVRQIAPLPSVKGITVQLFYPYDQGEAALALDQSERHQAINTVLDLKRRGYPILNSTRSLEAMIENTWHCHAWLLANVDPDGTVSTGCYVNGRGDVRCDQCGFTPVAEASGAFDLKPGSLLAGWRIFLADYPAQGRACPR